MSRKKMGEFQTAKIDFTEKRIVIGDVKGEYGMLGCGIKCMEFKENEFKKELVPQNAQIESFELNGEKFIRMVY